MKKIILLCCTILTISASAQLVRTGNNSPGYPRIYDRPLLVEMTKDSTFNDSLKAAFNEYWKISPVEFVPIYGLKNYDTDKKYNFYTNVSYGNAFNKILDKNVDMTGFGIFVSAKSMDDAVSANMMTISPNNTGVPALFKNPTYNLLRIKYTVAAVNNTIEFIEKNDIKGMTTQSYLKNMEEISKANAPKIKGKTLLILEEMTKPAKSGSKAYIDVAVLADYPFPYKIVSVDELNTITNDRDSKYCFLDMVIIDGKYFFIYDVATRNLLYASTPGYDFLLEKSDIKLFTKAINGD